MALIDLGREPSRRELNSFGLMLSAVAAVVGGMLWWRLGLPTAGRTVWAVGGGLALVYYAVPCLRRTIYFAWMYATYPLGWVVSHLVLAAIFYLVVTPTGLIMRGLGWDPLGRRFEPEAETYWIEYNPQRGMQEYFRQF